jgi:hypothetical protein
MKSLRLIIAIVALWPALAILTGCTQKKPVLVKPQQAPPTATAQPSPTPAPEATPSAPTEQAQPVQTPAPEQTNQEATDKDAAKKAQKPSPRVLAPGSSQKPASEARNNPPKRVIPADKGEPPLAGGQISPGPKSPDANSQATTDQLLQSAETNLNTIKRQLSKEEEAMRAQVKEFIAQSRKATGENDPARAHNFAVKAQWLSGELVKQR